MSNPVQVVCGHCDCVVRIPDDKLDQGPRCPKCKHALFDGHPMALKTASFDRHLTRNGLPLVVDFWAPWCGPCRMMAPNYAEAAHRLAAKARFAKVDSDEEPSLSARFGIRGIPTLILFQQGQEAARQSGAMDLAGLMRWLQLHLQAAERRS